ncbi:M20/M25/M40 family metallo-hydrolase [Natronomonas sp. EA1]|uniref:M20/M25/M40 family metallo-hydrolase n=1 Tax=Natronomonas sp. EA1 TaxID=3421655 RepID=UPI003EB865DF
MHWIAETFTSDTGWSHLESLVEWNRMAGSDGERAAAEATRDVLADHARNAHLREFDIQGWERGASSIEADGDHECLALPRSPAGEATGAFVDLGYGLPEDFEADLEGKIVMVASNVPSWYGRLIHRREKYYHAVEAGAAGFVFRNHIEGCLAPTGSVGTAEAPIGEIPAVGVSKEVGSTLARRFEGEELTVQVDCETPQATSQNVHAELGPDTDERVLVTSHVDAHDIAEGAMDNGAGTAMVVELARALAAREAELETKVEFVCFGAEEVGLLGSEYLAEQVDQSTIKAVLNNDGVVQGRNLTFYTHGFAGLRAAVETVGDRMGHPMEVNPQLGPHSDHWPFVVHGTPGIHVYAETGAEGRGWGHTRADTLDKLEKRDLREQAVLLTELAVALASRETELERKDEAELVERLEQEDLAEGMKITGDWPF